jgi:serine/threonine protein kinase/WD40 repeat protein
MIQDEGLAQASGLDEAEPPPEVPNFKVFYCIGRGGFGKVWLARDVIGQWRAIKTVYRRRFNDDAQGARDYQRELGAVRRYAPVSTRHENLLKIFYVGPENPANYFYYVMELADAEDPAQPFGRGGYKPRTLQSLVRASERLPARQCISIGLGLATALDELHRCKLLHRDIKPSNVIFVGARPRLADIGLVQALGEASSRVGTEGYVPPEGPGQAAGDIFALGKVLYVASTGLEPAKFPDPPASVWSEQGDPNWLELSEVLVKACQPNPTQRYQTPAAMRQDLLLLEAQESLVDRNRWQRRRAFLKKLTRWAGPVSMAVAVLVTWSTLRTTWLREKIGEVRDSRQGVHQDGWSTKHSALLEKARKFGKNETLFAEAAAGLGGLDMRLKCMLRGVAPSAIAFGPKGEALFGGSAGTNAHVYLPSEDRFERLPNKGAGPVAFGNGGQPVQLMDVGANRFALRDLRTGERLQEFAFQGGLQTSNAEPPLLALSMDLSKAAVAVRSDSGGQVAVWDIPSGAELLVTNELVTAVAFSPDGRCLALGMDDGRVRIWQFPQFSELPPLATVGHAAVHALAFGRDPLIGNSYNDGASSRLLAVGDGAAAIRIYRIPMGTLVSRCSGSAYDVRALAFRSDGTLLASGGREVVRLWDFANEKALLQTDWHLDHVQALAFSADGSRLGISSLAIGGTADPNVSLWDLEEGRGIQTLYGLGSRAETVWWSPNSQRIAALGQYWDLGIWSVPGGRLIQIIPLRAGGYQDNAAVAFSDNRQWLAVAAAAEVRLYDLEAGTRLKTWSVPMGYSDSLRFEGTNRLFFLHRENLGPGLERAWVFRDLFKSTESLWKQRDLLWSTQGTALPKNSDYFLVWGGPSDGSESSIKALSIDTGTEKWALKGSRPYYNCSVVLDPTDRLLQFLVSKERAGLYELSDGLYKQLTVHDYFAAAMSPLGEWFANTDGPTCFIYSPNARQKGIRICLDLHNLNRSEFSPDGKMLAIPTEEGQIVVANLKLIQQRLGKLGCIPR